MIKFDYGIESCALCGWLDSHFAFAFKHTKTGKLACAACIAKLEELESRDFESETKGDQMKDVANKWKDKTRGGYGVLEVVELPCTDGLGGCLVALVGDDSRKAWYIRPKTGRCNPQRDNDFDLISMEIEVPNDAD